MSAILSDCGLYRYRLDRDMHSHDLLSAAGAPGSGLVYAYFGINPSTADATIDDHTVKKWRGFTKVFGGRKFIVGNVFSYRSKDVEQLAIVKSPYGPDHLTHLAGIINDADILVPCWGNSSKVPASLHYMIKDTLSLLLISGKPVLHFGKTKAGDPLHPQMLAYSTPLVPWITP